MTLKRRALRICAITALAGTVMAPAISQEVVEEAVETMTSFMLLPASAPGRLTVRSCEDCPVSTFDFPASSRLFVGQHEVSLPEFRQAAQGRPRFAVVMYQQNAKRVTRVILSAE